MVQLSRILLHLRAGWELAWLYWMRGDGLFSNIPALSIV
jgi:hypothetical protein